MPREMDPLEFKQLPAEDRDWANYSMQLEHSRKVDVLDRKVEDHCERIQGLESKVEDFTYGVQVVQNELEEHKEDPVMHPEGATLRKQVVNKRNAILGVLITSITTIVVAVINYFA